MAVMIINGMKFEFEGNNHNLTICNGEYYVDGKKIDLDNAENIDTGAGNTNSFNINGNGSTQCVGFGNTVFNYVRKGSFEQNSFSSCNIVGGSAVQISIDGDIGTIECDENVNINSTGKVGSVKASGSVNCGNVSGDVSTTGSVNCGNVNGNVKTVGSVRCGNIKGSVRAGGSICY